MNYQLAETLLKLDNVSLRFGQKQVLRDINIEIKDIIADQCTGQVITLLGRSGVGKTQLFKIISGLMKPTTGTVLIGQKQIPVCPGLVGMVLQTYPLFKHMTLEQNLKLVCTDKSKINQYMADFDIFEHRAKYPTQLSGGQRQRAAIVQQILSSDHFILLDEPFSGLDPVATEKLCKVITKIANSDEQNTIIISSHILEPSIAISDHIWILGNTYTTDVLTKDSGKPSIYPEGATLLYNEDLAAQDLAWHPEIRKDPRFTQLVEKIRDTFQTI